MEFKTAQEIAEIERETTIREIAKTVVRRMNLKMGVDTRSLEGDVQQVLRNLGQAQTNEDIADVWFDIYATTALNCEEVSDE